MGTICLDLEFGESTVGNSGHLAEEDVENGALASGIDLSACVFLRAD